jgi:hypothetical protein
MALKPGPAEQPAPPPFAQPAKGGTRGWLTLSLLRPLAGFNLLTAGKHPADGRGAARIPRSKVTCRLERTPRNHRQCHDGESNKGSDDEPNDDTR